MEMENNIKKEIFANEFLDFKDFYDFKDRQSSSTTPLQTFQTAKHKSRGEKIFTIKTFHQIQKARLSRPPFEFKIWENLNLLKQKPKGIPPFQINRENQAFYQMIFDIPVKNLMEIILEEELKLEFREINQIFDNLVKTLAFLQTLNICPQGLKKDNIYIDKDTNQIYLIDLTMSFNKYPDNEIKENLFKCNVKALAMLFITLRGRESSAGNYADLSDLQKFEKFYISRLEKSERKRLFELMAILKKCMSENIEERPDFIDIFLTLTKQKKNFQALRDFIILKEDKEGKDSDSNSNNEISDDEISNDEISKINNSAISTIGNDEIIQRIKELKKYEKFNDDQIFLLEKKILNFDFECISKRLKDYQEISQLMKKSKKIFSNNKMKLNELTLFNFFGKKNVVLENFYNQCLNNQKKVNFNDRHHCLQKNSIKLNFADWQPPNIWDLITYGFSDIISVVANQLKSINIIITEDRTSLYSLRKKLEFALEDHQQTIENFTFGAPCTDRWLFKRIIQIIGKLDLLRCLNLHLQRISKHCNEFHSDFISILEKKVPSLTHLNLSLSYEKRRLHQIDLLLKTLKINIANNLLSLSLYLDGEGINVVEPLEAIFLKKNLISGSFFVDAKFLQCNSLFTKFEKEMTRKSNKKIFFFKNIYSLIKI